ncbi:gliding motility-associated C-terminal domain-containing protein [Cytophagaceae bacterium YF14B1]|uniref:Gliding motility-associated C-terminal domain-containing protein n=1 Tax=Xanthocytophaga flava TaxID=3048013 RepID=A0AAE3QXU1_9BACT|nr:gliding motility-associated C-terminal domain-containing protein [Xanthocytophaga flavus]MDJ1484734.1 gliding motility-associated C-terminal domain-containing protein [Xanthocytophaga flavus]
MQLIEKVYRVILGFTTRKGFVKNHLYIISLTVFLSVAGSNIYAQQPCFTISATKGCVPLTITADPSCGNYEPHPNPPDRYNYGDTISGERYAIRSRTHTYSKPGIYGIYLYGQFNGSLDSTKTPIFVEVYPTPKPIFSIQQCSGFGIAVQIRDSSYVVGSKAYIYDSYVIEWGDGNIQLVSGAGTYAHTYTSNTPRTVKVSGRYIDINCGGSESKNVIPESSLAVPELVSLTTNNANSALLQFRGEMGVTYRIEKRNESNGSYTQVASQISSTTGIVAQVLNDPQPATYRVVRTDACGNNLISEDISSVIITVSATNNQNLVTWNTYSPLTTIANNTLLRDGQVLLDNIAKVTTSYTDQAVICGDTNCYQFIVTLSSGANVLSNTQCVTAISNSVPSAVQNFTATIADNKVVLTWNAPAGPYIPGEYTVYKSEDGINFSPAARITTNRYEDVVRRLDVVNFCYRIGYLDKCGNPSDISPNACPIQLKVTNANSGEDGYTLNWTSYSEWSEGVQGYEVEKLDGSNVVLEQQVTSGNSLVFSLDTVNQLIRFRVRAIGKGRMSESNIVEIRQNARIFAPTAFTPNSDGVNDIFKIHSLFVQSWTIRIYNRWGEVVYASEDKNSGWDGKNKRSAIVMGTYSYQIEIIDQLGRSITKQGAVLILN